MTDCGPYAFISYAHCDDDTYLQTFFADLKKRVWQLGEVEEPLAVVFRYSDHIKTGDDFNSKILIALQTSKVLVCIYTRRFFERPYCGKEFAAFLKRNGSHCRFEPVQDEDDGDIKYQVRDPRNIIPIIWLGEGALGRKGNRKRRLPPHALRSIDYLIKDRTLSPRVVKDYQEHGLEWFYKKARLSRHDLVHYLADRIVAEEPLPVPDSPFTSDDLWDAFSDILVEPPSERALPTTPKSESLVEATPLAQGSLLGIEISAESKHAGDWTPYAGGPTLMAAVREIADDLRIGCTYLALDPNSDGFEQAAWTKVNEATIKLAIPILFIDSRCFKHQRHLSSIVQLLRRSWFGGVILPVDGSDKDTVRLAESSLPHLSTHDPEGARVVTRCSAGTLGAFRTTVDSVVKEVFRRIMEVGEVQRKPSQQEGPDTRPQITNFLDTTPSEYARRRWLY